MCYWPFPHVLTIMSLFGFLSNSFDSNQIFAYPLNIILPQVTLINSLSLSLVVRSSFRFSFSRRLRLLFDIHVHEVKICIPGVEWKELAVSGRRILKGADALQLQKPIKPDFGGGYRIFLFDELELYEGQWIRSEHASSWILLSRSGRWRAILQYSRTTIDCFSSPLFHTDEQTRTAQWSQV